MGLHRQRTGLHVELGSLGRREEQVFLRALQRPTKSFMLNFSLALLEELRGTGVTVSVLCPNGIRTNRGSRTLIERQGLAGRITCRYPDEVARAGLAGLERNKAIIVPGIVNKMLRLAGSFLPRALCMRVISGRWG